MVLAVVLVGAQSGASPPNKDTDAESNISYFYASFTIIAVFYRFISYIFELIISIYI